MPSALSEALRDRYLLERELGRGGMATVHLARDLKHDRLVALKVLHPELATALGSERFLLEIRHVARLQHLHILPIHDSGESAGHLWYTMPYVEGASVRSRLNREGELPIGETVRVLRDVADALAYAHEHGLVHRDIKPDNVLISGHHAVVADFGVAKALSAAAGGGSPHTSAGMTFGTPGYMPPEQAAGDPHVDARSDIYALGVLAYEMLTGELPFTGPTAQAVLAAQLTREPAALKAKRPNVPASLEALVTSCLQKRPADRPQSAEELVRQLEATLTLTPTGGPEALPVRRRIPRYVPAVLTAIVVFLAIGVLLRGRGKGPGKPAIDPDLVAVFPFRVSGAGPALAYLQEGMVELLAVKLTGDGGPRAVEPSAALTAWARDGARAFDRDSALRIGRTLGAGKVIVGSVVGSPSHLTLTASLFTGSRDGPRVSVEGPLDSLSLLVDRLTAGLLAGQLGTREQAGQLTTTSLPALRAYLNGQRAYRRGSYKEAVQHFDRALQVDSSFALAALAMTSAAGWCCGEEQQKGLRIAWAGRERLSTRDRAMLVAAAGPRYPAPSSELEQLGAWERAVSVVPDRPEAWYGLGDNLFHWGRVLALSSSWERAAEAFRRALQFDSTFAGPIQHLIEYAASTGDTATAHRLLRVARASDSTGEIFPYLRWRTATAVGDSAELRKIRGDFAGMKEQSLASIIYIAQFDGSGMEDVYPAVAAMQAKASTGVERELALYHAWSAAMNTGRPQEGVSVLKEYREAELLPHAALYMQILDAIFWGGDTAAAWDAARELSRSEARPLSGNRADDRHLRDLCFLEHWRISRGQTTNVKRTIAALRRGNSADIISLTQICSALLAAWQAATQKSPTSDAALAAFDSLALTGPRGWLDFQYGNLLLSRLFELRGNQRRALSVIRRRHYFLGPPLYLSSYLREEGRLAATLGDHTGAIEAYRHYLALRSNPEASVEPEVRAVKGELARLLGEH